MSRPSMPPRARVAACVALPALIALSGLAGCGIAPLDAQWQDASSPVESLRGSTVLVVCESEEPVVRQMCQDRVATELRTLGANTAIIPPTAGGGAQRAQEEARAVKARVIFITTISPDVPRFGGGSGVSVGIGMGGGFGGRGFGGFGMSAPIGGSRISQGYVANATLTDAASGRLMWTGKASTRHADNVEWQLDSLTKAVVSGVQQAGYF